MGKLQVKRIYEAPEETDGSRVLVDRLWPRGIKKEKAELTAWEKAIAPTNELRKAFGHDPEKFPAFAQKYEDELEKSPESGAFLEKIKSFLETGNVTLLYGAKDPEHNNAVVLKEWIEKRVLRNERGTLFDAPESVYHDFLDPLAHGPDELQTGVVQAVVGIQQHFFMMALGG